MSNWLAKLCELERLANSSSSFLLNCTNIKMEKPVDDLSPISGIKGAFTKDLFTIIGYSLIVLVSLLGNSFVLNVIASHQKYHTTTNILIASLATADLLTTTFSIPFNVTRFLIFNYPFGAIFCKLIPFIQVTCVYVSTLTMAVIAVHRFITLSSYEFIRNIRVSIVIVIVWLIGAILALPHSMFNQIGQVSYRNQSHSRCRTEYPDSSTFDVPFWFSVEAILTQYLIPLSFTGILYIWIGFVISKQNNNLKNNFHVNENNRQLISVDRTILNQQDAELKSIIIQFVVVVLAFAVCWFPLNGYKLLVDFHMVNPSFTTFLVTHWIAMTSVCCNPFIYCWWNKSFRKSVIRMLTCGCCGCCRKRIRTPAHS